MTAVQERRLRELRSRVLVRACRLPAAVVTPAPSGTVCDGRWRSRKKPMRIPREEAERLIAEGHRPDPIGGELEPRRIVLVVPGQRVASIASARPLAVRLSAELLAAECLALVPFVETPPETNG